MIKTLIYITCCILTLTQAIDFSAPHFGLNTEVKENDPAHRDTKNIVYSARGYVQGFKRGFYNSKNLEIRPYCFGNQTENMIFLVYRVFFEGQLQNMFIVPGFVYDLYLSATQECQMEELVYDIFEFCDNHNCTV
jgi:hypothetical protein